MILRFTIFISFLVVISFQLFIYHLLYLLIVHIDSISHIYH
jgi:hypothetical protein